MSASSPSKPVRLAILGAGIFARESESRAPPCRGTSGDSPAPAPPPSPIARRQSSANRDPPPDRHLPRPPRATPALALTLAHDREDHLPALAALGPSVVQLVAVYSRFVLESIIVNDVGPIRALRRSAIFSQTFFGPTVRFSLVAALVASGALRLWDTMIPSPPGLPVAIVLNSFLGTGIAIASMMFYYDRDRLIQRFAPAPSSTEHSRTPL